LIGEVERARAVGIGFEGLDAVVDYGVGLKVLCERLAAVLWSHGTTDRVCSCYRAFPLVRLAKASRIVYSSAGSFRDIEFVL
jgi:hypothetical protein